MPERACLRCGWEWESRLLKKPAACPACKSYKWALARDVRNVKAIDASVTAYQISDFEDPAEVPMSKDEKLANLRALMNGDIVPIAEAQKPADEVWRFTKDKPQHHEDGKVYRTQALEPDLKQTRVVEVDDFDYENILRIK